MIEIITDLEKLSVPAEPLEFITDTGISKDEGLDIIKALDEAFELNPNICALAAPQIGYNKRIFGIKFSDGIKYFINPIITKKTGLTIAPETFASMPNKEIVVGRPKEITVVYYTSDFKYEDNKLLDAAARLFDQMAQALDGVLPNSMGLVSDINEDGPLSELTEAEMTEVCDMWKKFIQTKSEKINAAVEEDEEIKKEYAKLKFTEDVINGRAQVIQDKKEDPALAKFQKNQVKKAIQKASFNKFIRSKK